MLTDGRTDARTDGRTDGRTDDGRKVITIAHPEQSSGELKIWNKVFKILGQSPLCKSHEELLYMYYPKYLATLTSYYTNLKILKT